MLITVSNKANHNNKYNHNTSARHLNKFDFVQTHQTLTSPRPTQDPQTATTPPTTPSATPPTTYVYPDQSGIEAHDALN